jgi:hypothetical protein
MPPAAGRAAVTGNGLEAVCFSVARKFPAKVPTIDTEVLMPGSSVRMTQGLPAADESRRPSVLECGVLTGMTGALTVALWFLVLDAARGQLFFTPTLLGSVLFLGRGIGEVTTVNAILVFAYTGLHGVLFILAGTALAWMFLQFERNPQLGLVLLLLFVLFQSVLFGLEVSMVPTLVGAVGTVAVGVANLFAACTMFWFLLRRHPAAVERLREAWNA